jgi:hypothetical protein
MSKANLWQKQFKFSKAMLAAISMGSMITLRLALLDLAATPLGRWEWMRCLINWGRLMFRLSWSMEKIIRCIHYRMPCRFRNVSLTRMCAWRLLRVRAICWSTWGNLRMWRCSLLCIVHSTNMAHQALNPNRFIEWIRPKAPQMLPLLTGKRKPPWLRCYETMVRLPGPSSRHPGSPWPFQPFDLLT